MRKVLIGGAVALLLAWVALPAQAQNWVIINGMASLRGGLRLIPQSATPLALAGRVYYDSDDNALVVFNGTSEIALGGLDSPVFVDDVDLGAAGVRLAGADGVLTLLGLGNGNDENLAIDFDNAAANTIALTSGTGASIIAWTGAWHAGEIQLAGAVNGTLSVDKAGALGTKRFGFYVGDGTAGTTADDNYIKSLNTDLHVLAGATGTSPVLDVLNTGQVVSLGTAPAVGNVGANSCGTTAATITASATDHGGKVTVGATSGSECRITFVATWPNAPTCFVSNETTAALARTQSTTTTLDLEGVFVAGDVLAWGCSGQK